METNTPPFNEKRFLLCLLSIFSDKYGDERRFLDRYTFNAIEPDHYQALWEIYNSSDTSRKKFIYEWFKEAEVRGFVKVHQNHFYKLTDEGYDLAIKYKHRVKSFIKNHLVMSVTVGTTLVASLINLLAALIRSQC